MGEWTVPGYASVRDLGSGATGRVMMATQDDTGRNVAIKYLSPALAHSSQFAARFRAEARLLTELDVDHIARIYDYVEDSGGAAIVMELVEGPTLRALLDHSGATTPQPALTVLKGSLLGLAAAHHRGVVHRDYKPENVLIDSRGISKLTDFGIAVRAGRRMLTEGTPLYMAPEQWNGGMATPATDVYAATATFYECLTGAPPYHGNIRQLRHAHESAPIPADKVDQPLRGLVSRGLAKSQAQRPPDAAAFLAELEETARRAYGADWEEGGRGAIAALALLVTGSAAGATAAATAISASTKAARSGARHGTTIVAGSVAGAAAIAVVTVLAIHGLAATGRPKPAAQASQPNTSARVIPTGASTPRPRAPSVATVSECVVGTWKTVAETESGPAPASYTSGTEIWRFSPTGSGTYTDSDYITTGAGGSDTFNGSETFSFRVAGDDIIFSSWQGQITGTSSTGTLTGTVSGGTFTISGDGVSSTTGGSSAESTGFTCSASSMTLDFPDDKTTVARQH